eukprot:CAMPEP_0184741638 /NCGR_PEP_ID=MMETSP0315-20130426/4685_1 /TAXON_ID=101924 /ORGANISM="Rhodosorus marinus, Strain UTEX LB 2760" /LENGTH=59 /DNA_ID=CAMNT_0027212081 /DNA_START=755 /DNA_END=935 /DNA_ORIENTATION=+
MKKKKKKKEEVSSALAALGRDISERNVPERHNRRQADHPSTGRKFHANMVSSRKAMRSS